MLIGTERTGQRDRAAHLGDSPASPKRRIGQNPLPIPELRLRQSGVVPTARGLLPIPSTDSGRDGHVTNDARNAVRAQLGGCYRQRQHREGTPREHQLGHRHPHAVKHCRRIRPISGFFVVGATRACPRVPRAKLPGKEGVSGSSPEEGFAKTVQIAARRAWNPPIAADRAQAPRAHPALRRIRPATSNAEAIRPQSLAVASAGRQLEYLSLLHHRWITPSVQESTPPPPGS
jgi:hypothetical protein